MVWIAEREGSQPQKRKKWAKILDASGALACAIPPMHSTFIVARKWADWLHDLCCVGDPRCFVWGTKLALASKWADGLHNGCRMGVPQHFSA